MKKLTKYVLTICVLVLFLMPVVSNAAELENCDLTNNKLISLTSNNIGDVEKVFNTISNKSDLQNTLNDLLKNCPTDVLANKNIKELIERCQVNVPAKAEQPADTNTTNTPAPKTTTPADTTTQEKTKTPATVSPSGSYEKQVIDLVNQERQKNGLQPLKENAALSNVAEAKAKDLRDNNYFAHTSPVYGSPFDMMKQFGISYSSAGENIAKGQRTPEEVMNGWMNSEGHRANILNANFTEIGVGYVTDNNGNTYWVQHFIRP